MFKRGQIVENCNYHPVLVTEVDESGDGLTGVDLFTARPTACSIQHCGVFVMTTEQIVARFTIRDQLLAAEERLRASGGDDRAAWDALGLE